MLPILFKTLPFFVLIGLGYTAGRTRFFTQEATAALTKFVFYFALPAMLFRFAATLDIAQIWDGPLAAAYLSGTIAVYLMATAVGWLRRLDIPTNAVEAQCSVIGNVGFLGLPMLAVLLGEAAVAPMILILSIDLIVFSSLIVILITGSRDGRVSLSILRTIGLGLVRNPMIMAITSGLLWSAAGWPIPAPANDFLLILGAAATPGALFAIGASLASKNAERIEIAGWLSFAKLILHPAAVAFTAYALFPVTPFAFAVVVACAAMPVAGNVYILAQHYGVAPQRVSASILLSTALSVITLTAVIGWVSP
ncbi:AEC family transporter [uncultured Tateyamaria sp.]|uniref:AEC family transporter n=1 Tax=Tateyamaria sp. 1078 TaxID=3417464 RepID=UPI00261858A3|nr:AEC family transporter [uncultured Tateyamaria sp.]